MRRRLATVLVALAALGAGAAPITQAAPSAVTAKSCRGYVRATIGGKTKCLRRGQFCAHRYDSQYRRYGFRCTRRDAGGRYHLT
jgi:hypothetical protein